MKRLSPGQFMIVLFAIAVIGFGILLSRMRASTADLPATNTPRAIAQVPTLTATPTLPPYTPLATLTPSNTLRPPPTFEPPTLTIAPSLTPSITPTPTIDLGFSIPGLIGLQTPTLEVSPGCAPRKDWKLTYTVQRDDALSKIATLYNTSIDALVQGNCLSDRNVIVIGQVLKVPGTTQPTQPAVVCVPFELSTPMDGTRAVGGNGPLTFDWHGPRAPYNLIRIWRPDGSKYEDVVELRQNEAIDLSNLPAAGTYTWYIYPLDHNFVQVCPEGGPWTFSKSAFVNIPKSPTPTP